MPRNDRTSLSCTFLDRVIRPYSFVVSIASSILLIAVGIDVGPGKQVVGLPGDILMVWAAITVTALVVGWWKRSDRMMLSGLLWSTSLWAAAGVFMAFGGVSYVYVALAWCWVLASGGAWLLERQEYRHRRRRES